MEPIPETLQAVGELDALVDDAHLIDQLRATADRAREVAPGIVGVSVAARDQGITFTLVATDEEIAVLDAVQYVAGGPCVDAMDLGHGIATSPEGLLSESRWQDFARASAAAGVRSTLTLPVVQESEVVATINLYGHAEDTFVGAHEALAEVFGAWASGAVVNADLGFTTRTTAEQAPAQLKRVMRVETATGILAAARRITLPEARQALEDAARRARVSVAALADVVVDLHHLSGDD